MLMYNFIHSADTILPCFSHLINKAMLTKIIAKLDQGLINQ